MTGPGSVTVVGASAAGLSTVEALRRGGHDGPVTLLGAEPHPPYDRPPLSEQVLSGAWEPGRARLRDDERLAALDARILLGDPALALDVARPAPSPPRPVGSWVPTRSTSRPG